MNTACLNVGGRALAGLQGALGDQAGVCRPVREAGIGDWGHLVPINRRRYKCLVFAVARGWLDWWIERQLR